MATVTLAESAKLAQDDLVAGLIENIVTVNQIYQSLPFDGIAGNALAYNRENALGPVATTGIGDTDGVIGAGASGTNSTERAAAKDAATFTQITSTLTTIMGDAEVNGLIQATRSSDGNDQTQVQIASKAKSAGRKFQDMLINGTGANFTFPGLLTLVSSGQMATTGATGSTLSFAILDELLSLVTDKDGEVDYFAMNIRTINSFYALLRGLGGAGIGEVIELPNGKTIPSYRGTGIYRNDYIPITQTKGGTPNCSTIFAGNFDDGTRAHGITGLTAQDASGLHVERVGTSHTKDEIIWRVKWYVGLALFSDKALAAANGITN